MTRLDRHGVTTLEPRERELLSLYVELGSYKQVAERMGLTLASVRHRASRILAALEVTAIGQACVLYDRTPAKGTAMTPTREPSVTPRNEAADRLRALIELADRLADSVLSWQSGHITEGKAQEYRRMRNEGDPDDADADAALRTERLRVVPDAPTLAKALHGFLMEVPTWPHSEVRPRSSPNKCWPCWNGADHILAALTADAVAGLTGEEPSE